MVSALAQPIAELSKTLPAGYAITMGGTVEESAKSQASVLAVVPVMLVIMLSVLMFQLQGFQRLIMVLSVAPLGLIGVVGALLLSGRPLGFVAILGILALLGMITKNAVILLGQIDAERAAGKDVWNAARRCLLGALPAHHAHGHLHRARHDPHRLDGVLGPNGLRHHGRAAGGHRADADLPAHALRHVVRLAGEARGRRKAKVSAETPAPQA